MNAKSIAMNWETVTSDLGNKVYALWNNGRQLLTMASSSGSNFVKLECEGIKRTFQIRYEGFKKNRIVMRNEYGVRIGQVKTENKEQFIELNDRKYFFSVDQSDKAKVSIFDESRQNEVASCELNPVNEKNKLTNLKDTSNHHGLLLALCWYLFATVSPQLAEPV